MYKILYGIFLILGIGGIFYNYKKGNLQTKDIGIKALAVSVILAILLVSTFFIK